MNYYAYYNDHQQGLATFLSLDGALEFIAARANSAGVLDLGNYAIFAGTSLPLVVKSTVAVVEVDAAQLEQKVTKAEAAKILGKG